MRLGLGILSLLVALARAVLLTRKSVTPRASQSLRCRAFRPAPPPHRPRCASKQQIQQDYKQARTGPQPAAP